MRLKRGRLDGCLDCSVSLHVHESFLPSPALDFLTFSPPLRSNSQSCHAFENIQVLLLLLHFLGELLQWDNYCNCLCVLQLAHGLNKLLLYCSCHCDSAFCLFVSLLPHPVFFFHKFKLLNLIVTQGRVVLRCFKTLWQGTAVGELQPVWPLLLWFDRF